jgi:hypothetical protein
MDSNPLLVMDDFSAARQPPNQTTIHAFWTAAEQWIKPLGLEDLANLELEVPIALVHARGRLFDFTRLGR